MPLLKFQLLYGDGFWKDFQEIISCYDVISADVCNRYLDELWIAGEKIEKNPFAFSMVSNIGYRRLLFKKFPFKMFFKIDTDTVYIIALIHESRHCLTKQQLKSKTTTPTFLCRFLIFNFY